MLERWLDPIDNYCERTDASLWSEPLNAATNIAFFIAAYYLFKLYKSTQIKNHQAIVLIALTSTAGMGSLLFHTFGNTLTMILDVFPIMLFVAAYLWTALRQFFALRKHHAAMLLAVFFTLAPQARHIPAPYDLNGSIAYIPCLIALLLMALSCKHQPTAKLLFQATGLFLASLTFRSVDMVMCPSFPIGTHILWHMLNGMVLYLLTRAVILAPKGK